ncbi:hypothetical protein CERZMDRAFT_85479 [Cercospora zeae-maydis SCOH1-5]|uniref:Uncharacterized protein n=1 Tax=Cercospora zeae-maydis SCOH1-5 TaxID=717836 RepID=A0A6A6FCY3_9PEZI|nr:hypothetical protein CERZMDRAFT_85479 [Cercospora zeae-maydis SCOH1-5]
MQLTLATSVLALSAFAWAEADNGQHGAEGAQAIESAVTSLASQTNLPDAVTSLAPALSSAGVTGVMVSGTPESTGKSHNDKDNDDKNDKDGDDDQNENDASLPVPQVVVAGSAAGLGMAVLALL